MATMDRERGQRLRLIRKTLGENQIEFGERFDKTGPAISNYERGRLPEDEILKSLHDMGFSIDWLLSGEGYMHRRVNTQDIQDEFYATVLESFTDGVTIVQDGVHKYVNESLEHIMGYSRGELISEPYEAYAIPSEKVRVRSHYEKYIDGESLPEHDVFTIRCRNGKTKKVKALYISVLFRGNPAVLTVIREVDGTPSSNAVFSNGDPSIHPEERKLVRVLKALLKEVIREDG